jgi:5-methylcytosine-specific restriction endonuclease McrA
MFDRPKIKLKTLQPRVKELPPRVQPLRAKRAKSTGRNADPRRTLALNSAAWQKLRASVLAASPLCVHCRRMGRGVLATDLDHRNGDPSDNSLTNLQPLCHSCHSKKTAADKGKETHQGCDVNGMPLDPRHRWNSGT